MELRGRGGGAGDEGNDDASIPGWFRASLASFEYTEFLSELLFSSWKEKKDFGSRPQPFQTLKKTNKLWEKKKSMVSERVHVSSIEILVRVFKTDDQNQEAWIGCTKQLGSCCQLDNSIVFLCATIHRIWKLDSNTLALCDGEFHSCLV